LDESNMDGIGTKFRQLETAMRCLSAIVENSQESVAVVGLDGELLYANPAWAKMHGYQASRELVGRHIRVFLEQAESGTAALIEQVRHTGRLTKIVGHRRADGTTFSSEMILVGFRDGVGRTAGFIAFVAEPAKGKNTSGQPEVAGPDRENRQLKQEAGELLAVKQQLSEQFNARARTEQQLKKCQQELEFLVGELSQARELLKQEQKKYTEQMQTVRRQLSQLKEENKRLNDEIAELKHQEVEYLDDIANEKGEVNPVRGLDTEELKALSEMAKKYVRT
jgi:PAS domain S-box-containing protein